MELRASLQRQARGAVDAVPDNEAADSSATPDPAPVLGAVDTGTTEVNPSITVWANENRLTSKGKTRESSLKQTVRIDDEGIRTAMVHVSGMSVIATVRGNKPFAKGEKVITQDAFDQSQALATAEEFLKRLEACGVDLKTVYRDREANDGVLRFLVNQTSEGNADYAPGANSYIFGTDEGGFHLASCKDIIIHELGHGFVDHVAHGLTADEEGEGQAFHEAMGDLFAATFFGNPNISEDFAAYLATRHKTTPEAAKALRCIANDDVLSASVKEEHKRSLVYSGMLWRVTEKLAERVGLDAACEAMFGLLVKVPFVLTAKSPTPEQLAHAFADAARAALDAKTAKAVVADLQAEALKRNVIGEDVDLSVPADNGNAKVLDQHVAGKKASLLGAAAVTFAEAAAQLPALAKRRDIRFEVLNDRHGGDLRRVTLRCVAEDPSSHANIPIEDGLLDIIVGRDGVHSVAGGALSLPASFDFAAKTEGASQDFAQARGLLAEHFASCNTAAADIVHRAFDTLFDEENVRLERVMSSGRLCLEVRTLAGEFVVDLESNVVKIRRLLHAERTL